MQKILLTLLLIFSFGRITYAQNEKGPNTCLYLNSGGKITGKVLSVSDDGKIIKISYDLQGNIIKIVQREKVLLAFNERGNYLVISNLSDSSGESAKQLSDFYSDMSSKRPDYDIIFKAVPFDIIACNIIYNGEAINYKLPNAGVGSINKENVLAIIYKDGSHELVRDIAEITPILRYNSSKFESSRYYVEPPKVVEEPKPTITKTAPIEQSPTREVIKTKEPEEIEEDLVTNTNNKKTRKTEEETIVIRKKVKTEDEEDLSEETEETEEISDEPEEQIPNLTEQEKKKYQRTSIERVEEFKDYLNVIGDKSRSLYEKAEARKNALKLFTPGAFIEVTSKNRPGARRIPVETYLRNLSNLNYSSINIEYANLKFVRNFVQHSDGNYYGLVSGEQSFQGYRADGKAVYSDMVRKNYKVKLEAYQKYVDGEEQTKWKVLFGDVSVSQ